MDKLCKDCIYAMRPSVSTHWHCARPKLNLITGEDIPFFNSTDCRGERLGGVRGSCDIEGRYWEEK